MSLEAQIERLANAVETLNGVLAARNPTAAAAPAAEVSNTLVLAPQAADKPLGDDGAATSGKGPGRPRTRYYHSAETNTVVKTSGDPLVAPWKEITKAEYDRLNTGGPTSGGKKATPPASDTANAADPFADDSAPAAAASITLDDVREMGLKLRDATSMDIAKSLVAEFGVAKLADLPAEKFGEFIKKAQAKIDAAKGDL